MIKCVSVRRRERECVRWRSKPLQPLLVVRPKGGGGRGRSTTAATAVGAGKRKVRFWSRLGCSVRARRALGSIHPGGRAGHAAATAAVCWGWQAAASLNRYIQEMRAANVALAPAKTSAPIVGIICNCGALRFPATERGDAKSTAWSACCCRPKFAHLAPAETLYKRNCLYDHPSLDLNEVKAAGFWQCHFNFAACPLPPHAAQKAACVRPPLCNCVCSFATHIIKAPESLFALTMSDNFKLLSV
jgi:hypothetical protein